MSFEKEQNADASEELARSLRRAPANDLLSIAPPQYREFAEQFKDLSRATNDIQQRALFLKLANQWLYAAIRYEAGLGAVDSSQLKP
jgi:hypothetical protein